MTTRGTRHSRWFVTIIALMPAASAFGSQAAAHVYVALETLAQAPPQIRPLLQANVDAYLAGAVGPDVTYAVHPAQLLMGVTRPNGSESHYEKTGQLAVAMLRLAQTDRDKAFAFGWLTHYWQDISVHQRVNMFGGYYADHRDRHVELEFFETKHVLHSLVPERTGAAGNLDTYATPGAGFPAEFVSRVFNSMYPQVAEYQPAGGAPAPFVAGLRSAADNVAKGTTWFVNQERGTAAGGGLLETLFGRRLPTTQEYDRIMKPLLIENVEADLPDFDAGGDQARLRVRFRVNDLRLLKPFIDEWFWAITTARQLSFLNMEKWLADPDGFTLADINLDTALPIGRPYSTANEFPGNPTIENALAFVKITDPDGNEVSAWQPDGQWVSLGNLPETIWDGRAGPVTFEVPFKAVRPGTYAVEVRLQFARAADKKPYGVEANWQGTFGQQGAPAQVQRSIVFLVDCSGSMGGQKLQDAKAAVKAAVRDTDDGKTQWALLGYGGHDVWEEVGFTTDVSVVERAVNGLTAGGDTPLTYALYKAIAYARKNGRTPQGRVVVLCDGQDNCPQRKSVSQEEAMDRLQKILRDVRGPVTNPQQPGGG